MKEVTELPTEWELIEKSNLDEKLEAKLLEAGIVIIHGELTHELCEKTCKRLLYLKTKHPEQVTVILNSVGGQIFDSLLVYETIVDLVKSGIKVIVEARGLAASMAVIILQAGSERVASRYTRFLLHEASASAAGEASKLKDESEELDRLNTMLDSIIVQRSKISFQKLRKKTKRREWWLTAEEALKYGLIDRIA